MKHCAPAKVALSFLLLNKLAFQEVILSRADGEGPPSCSLRYSKDDHARSKVTAEWIAEAVERL